MRAVTFIFILAPASRISSEMLAHAGRVCPGQNHAGQIHAGRIYSEEIHVH